jgi:hypothetical protein
MEATAVERHEASVLVVSSGYEDVRNPRRVGAFLGVPSHRPPGTAAAIELWAEIKADREF